MPDQIKPALTVGEWEDFTADDLATIGKLSSIGDGVGLYDADAREPYRPASPERHHHAGMALHNYALPDDHAGKITREDVADLLSHADGALWRRDMTLAATLSAVAAKLAAILPPEGAC